jgi:hypothetical protein
MTETNTREAWDRFAADAQNLAGQLRRNYRTADDRATAAEINRTAQQLGKAAEAFFASLDAATKDPEVRASTKQTARSFGAALAETLREAGEALDKALKQETAPK